MGKVLSKPFRKVVFTDIQMQAARGLEQFRGKDVSHRTFVEWLFGSQHKVAVINHEMLTYQYLKQRNNKNQVVYTIIIVEGHMGKALTAL